MNNMKTILFVAQDSFPLHGAESIVNLKLLSALSKSGKFTIDLISKKAKGDSYGANSLEELGIKVRNVYALEVDNKFTLSTVWEHFLCLLKFGIVFKGSHWAVHALAKVKDLCREYNYDYVITKNQASVLIGYYLKKHLGLKWIATWNDPFPSSLYPKVYKDFFNEKDSWAYRKIISVTRKYVDKVVVPNPRLRDYLLPFYGMERERTVVIPHVVINSNMPLQKCEDRIDDTLRILHSGNISYPRNPKVLLEGLSLLLRNHPDCRIALDILGIVDDSLRELISSYGLDSVVKIIPPVSYIDSLQMLKNYDAAIVVEAVLDEGIFLPTKVSDFMQCNKAICAVSPKKGVLNDLYKNGNIGYFADNTSPDSVCDMINKLYSDFKCGGVKANTVPYEYTEKYIINEYLNF